MELSLLRVFELQLSIVQADKHFLIRGIDDRQNAQSVVKGSAVCKIVLNPIARLTNSTAQTQQLIKRDTGSAGE